MNQFEQIDDGYVPPLDQSATPTDLTATVRQLRRLGLRVRDVAELLRVHERAVEALIAPRP